MAISEDDIFWFAAGLLTALAAGFVLAPLLPSAPSLRTRLRMARWPLVTGALLIPLALGLYLWHGSPDHPSIAAAASPGRTSTMGAPASNATAAAAGSMEAMLARLEQRLAKQGGSDADWQLLAQTYDFLGRKAESVNSRTRHQLGGSSAPATDVPATAAAAVTDVANTTSGSAAPAARASPKVEELISR